MVFAVCVFGAFRASATATTLTFGGGAGPSGIMPFAGGIPGIHGNRVDASLPGGVERYDLEGNGFTPHISSAWRGGGAVLRFPRSWNLLGTVALAAGPPRFKDYPVADIFRGRPAAPVLASQNARRFGTQLRNSVKYGPNFAGHYTVAQWGCGAGCVTVAVIDAESGQVWFAPFRIEDKRMDGGVLCNHGSEFKVDSDLYIATGEVNGRVGTHYFRWRQSNFSPVHFEAQCS